MLHSGEDDVRFLSQPPTDALTDMQLLDVLESMDYVVELSQLKTDPALFEEIVPGFKLGAGEVRRVLFADLSLKESTAFL